MKTHNIITDNCEKKSDQNISLQLFDSTIRRLQRPQLLQNTMSELKAVLEMTTVRPDTS